MRAHRILDYRGAVDARLAEPPPPWKHFPSVMVGWDSTARHPRHATIFEGATPDAYRTWLERTVASVSDVRAEENYVFLLAWNEWAEGNHLEPDQRFGRAFLEATRDVLLPGVGTTPEVAPTGSYPEKAVGADDRARWNVNGLMQAEGAAAGTWVQVVVADDGRATARDLVALRASDGVLGAGPDGQPSEGHEVHVDVEDGEALVAALRGHAEVGALLLIDVVGRLRRPHVLLSRLSTWSSERGTPLFLVEPNATHLDRGLSLLAGTWDPGRSGDPGDGRLHAFTEASLTRLAGRCGWAELARDDVAAVESERFDGALADNLPPEMVGALTVMAEAYNPQWAIETFVWALAPTADHRCPGSFAEAVAPDPDETPRHYTEEQHRALARYLASVGLVTSETNRRATAQGRPGAPAWRRTLGRLAESSPRTASAYRRLRGGPA